MAGEQPLPWATFEHSNRTGWKQGPQVENLSHRGYEVGSRQAAELTLETAVWNQGELPVTEAAFPEFITGLPEADIAFPGIRGWISQSTDHQLVFMEIEPTGLVAPHSHGEQWGIVVEGEMELTIGGETRTYRQGDSYHIRAGVEHAARFLTHVRAIDVFADPDRYKPK